MTAVGHQSGCKFDTPPWVECDCNTSTVEYPPNPEISPRASVLREAEALITGDRNKAYGSPTENFANIAALWNVQFGHKLKDGEAFSPEDTALAMIHVKMARIIAQPKRDNWTDIAGYAACGYEASEEAA